MYRLKEAQLGEAAHRALTEVLRWTSEAAASSSLRGWGHHKLDQFADTLICEAQHVASNALQQHLRRASMGSNEAAAAAPTHRNANYAPWPSRLLAVDLVPSVRHYLTTVTSSCVLTEAALQHVHRATPHIHLIFTTVGASVQGVRYLSAMFQAQGKALPEDLQATLDRVRA
jgi:hypothetical protein